jgi:hypothetical protein
VSLGGRRPASLFERLAAEGEDENAGRPAGSCTYGRTVIVDTTAAARRADPERAREWLANQRAFISSAMADTAEERQRVAAAIEELGVRPLWFEEFGRDADPAEAYLAEVDLSTIYLAILKELYGRQLPSGFSATETEYERAREGGKRVAVYIAAGALGREGHLNRFIDRVRTFVVTENYADADDLVRRVQRRLQELGDEAVSPWVKLDELIFRADEIEDAGATITIRARASDEIAHRLEQIRDESYGRQPVRFVYDRVREGELRGLHRTVRSGGTTEITIELAQAGAPQTNAMRAGTSGQSADELVELAMRALFLGEHIPEQIAMMGLAETGIDADDLRQAFELSNEIAPAVARLVVADGHVGSGRAHRLTALELGPRVGDGRRVAIEWEEPRAQTNVEPRRRSLEGRWSPR